MPVSLKSMAPQSQVKHSTTEPLHFLYFIGIMIIEYPTINGFFFGEKNLIMWVPMPFLSRLTYIDDPFYTMVSIIHIQFDTTNLGWFIV